MLTMKVPLVADRSSARDSAFLLSPEAAETRVPDTNGVKTELEDASSINSPVRDSTMASVKRRKRKGVIVDRILVFPNPKFTTPKDEKRFLHLTRSKCVKDSVEFVLKESVVTKKAFNMQFLLDSTSLQELRSRFLFEYLQFLQGHFVGAEWRLFKSIDEDEIFAELYLREKSAKYHAEVQNHKLQLHHTVARKLGIRQMNFTASKPWIEFERELEEKYKEKYNGDLFTVFTGTYADGSIFCSGDRITLLSRVMNMYADVQDLEKYALIRGSYPVHQKSRLLGFSQWANFKNVLVLDQPIDDIRHYFGPEVAFYFCWVGFLTQELLSIAVPGIIIEMSCYIMPHNFYYQLLSVYCVAIAYWSTLFITRWKHEEMRRSFKWGTEGLEKNSIRLTSAGVSGMRPDYSGEYVESKIDNNILIKKQAPRGKFYRRLCSRFIVSSFIMVVIISVIGIFIFRSMMVHAKTPYARRIAAFCNSIQIKIFDFIWERVAIRLCEWENYRTDLAMKQALIWKIFLFKFVNAFNSMFYIAFVKRDVEGCPNDDCIPMLTTQVCMVFGVNTLLSVMEMVLPYVKFKCNRWKEDRKLSAESKKRPRSFLEDQNKMVKYGVREQIDDYMVIIIQYGFVVMFGNVVPIVAVIAVLSNMIQIRADAWKLCNTMQRPHPVEAEGIGAWATIQNLMSWAGVVTNVGLCVFQLPLLHGYALSTRIIIFFIAEHICMALKLWVTRATCNVPSDIVLAKKRSRHIEDTLMQGTRQAVIPPDLLVTYTGFPTNITEFETDFIDSIGRLEPGDENFEATLDKTPACERHSRYTYDSIEAA